MSVLISRLTVSATRRVTTCAAVVLFVAATCVAAPANKPPVSEFCIDVETGRILYEAHADVPRPPASMTKLMLMLLIDEGIERNAWSLATPVTVSEKAQRMGGTQLFLAAGDVWPLGDLVNGLAVASANDAAMAIAEALWGSESACLEAMNARAVELGMIDTAFNSVHGLPPDPGEAFDRTTARDMARLARTCVKRERILAWTNQRSMEFGEKKGLFHNTNKLLWRMPDCDGLKTGYIRAAGFCIAATAEREGIRLISIAMGSPSKYGRFNRAEELMDDGYAHLAEERLAKGDSIGKLADSPQRNATPEG